jgi:hypothetical protein
MADVTFRGACLEINSRPDKNDSTKVYHSLIVFEPGQRFPQVTKINLHPNQLETVRPAIGKNAGVVCEMHEYQGRVSYSFRAFAA